MKQKPFNQRMGDFMEGKGFYIVLFLCVAAIGISGYFLMTGLMSPAPQTLETPMQQVTGDAQVEVPRQQPNVVTPAPDSSSTAGTAEEDSATTEPEHDPQTASSTASQATVFTWPVRGTISRDFSLEAFAYDATMGDWRTHSGLDIEAGLGAEVMAITAGTVSSVTQDALMGSMVIIDHGDGLESVYANLNAVPTVAVGDTVSPGTVLGAIGETAIAESSGPNHLHFEMRKDGVSIDPVAYLPEGA